MSSVKPKWKKGERVKFKVEVIATLSPFDNNLDWDDPDVPDYGVEWYSPELDLLGVALDPRQDYWSEEDILSLTPAGKRAMKAKKIKTLKEKIASMQKELKDLEGGK